jgi:hypothetical protein
MIGYYVHHQGQGHLTRARCIAAVASEQITVLSSLTKPADPRPFADWIQLPIDDEDPPHIDPTANGALHFAPQRGVGYRRRMQRLAEWIREADPTVFAVDVSVEVTAFVRLLGVPVVVVAGPGKRDDPPHALGYQLATHIVAPWPRDIYSPAHLEAHAAKTSYAGAFSRFDGVNASAPPGRRVVVVLFGGGGAAVSRQQIAAAEAATPEWTWKAFGGDELPWTDDVWVSLQEADVVVSHGGQNAIAELAAARRPAVLIPQPRPFREQDETAAALETAGLATVCRRWPAAEEWPGLLAETAGRDGTAWKAWNAGDGAELAAKALCANHG